MHGAVVTMPQGIVTVVLAVVERKTGEFVTPLGVILNVASSRQLLAVYNDTLELYAGQSVTQDASCVVLQ